MIEPPRNAKHVGEVLKNLIVLRLVAAGDLARDFNIAARCERGQQIELLKHKANLRLAQNRAPGVAEPGKVDTVDQDASRGRARQAAKNIEERRFAAA